MKLKYIIITLAVFSITACKDFLEPDSPSTFDQNYIFSNAEDARKAVNAIYVHFSKDGFRSRLSNNMAGNTDIEHNWGTGSTARYELWRLEPSTNNNDLKQCWEAAYQAIRDANICIEGILASPALNSSTDGPMLKHLLGESYTLRAYWYSMLTYHFGDVPFITEAPKAGNDFNPPKTDRNEILTTVIQDMIGAEANMMWADQVPYGIEQGNREYTLGMIARLALQRGGYYLTPGMFMERKPDYADYYTIARDYSKKLIDLKDRPLPTNFKQVFMNQNQFISPENEDILFEVPFAIGFGDVGWNIGYKVDAGTHPYGTGSNYMNMPVTYFYSFDKEDVRRDATCGLYFIDKDFVQQLVAVGSISQAKWGRQFVPAPQGSTTSKGTGINWPMLRYSDVLLMYAEAENELNGPTAGAIEAFKRVRKRAFPESAWATKVDAYTASVAGSPDAFFDAIVDERAWEFGGEMIRKYELIRWNLYKEKCQETVDGLKDLALKANDGTGVLPDKVYVKLNANGELLIYNKDEKVLVAPDDSWTTKDWLISLYDAAKPESVAEFITTHWANYTKAAPVRYVYPIPQDVITASKGILLNDGYGYGE
jgi:starch-binding outer membrane protein, SusD/RagB family